MNCNRKTLRIGLMAKNITVTIMHFVLAYSYLFWTYCLFLFANTFRSGAGLAQATKKIFSSAGENERRIKYELNNGNEDHKRNSNAEAAKGTAKRVEKTNECKSKSDERERKQKNREIKRNSPQQSVRWMCALFSIWNDDDDEDDDEYDGVALRFFLLLCTCLSSASTKGENRRRGREKKKPSTMSKTLAAQETKTSSSSSSNKTWKKPAKYIGDLISSSTFIFSQFSCWLQIKLAEEINFYTKMFLGILVTGPSPLNETMKYDVSRFS